MPLTRRQLLRAGAASAATVLLAPGSLLRARDAGAADAEPVLVVLFLRGAADWLSLVPPHGDERYYALRPTIAVPRREVLPLDGLFGLHPELRPLLRHYQAGRLAVVQAFGSPHETRSHFEAQDYLESAAPGDRRVRTGWLGRYAAQVGLREPWAALTLGSRPALALAGAPASFTLPSLGRFKLQGSWNRPRRLAIERIAAVSSGAWGHAARSAFEALALVENGIPAARASWPSGPLALALRDLARLIRARIGVRVASVDMGGWDHHVDLVHRLPRAASELAEALDAFTVELGSELERTLVLVLTEFGRSAVENGGRGTDHGRGGALLALGGGVRGGRVLLRNGRWPGLGPSQLVDGRDLAVTTDFRDVFAEALRRHMRVSNVAPIFPGYSVSTSRFPGLFG